MIGCSKLKSVVRWSVSLLTVGDESSEQDYKRSGLWERAVYIASSCLEAMA